MGSRRIITPKRRVGGRRGTPYYGMLCELCYDLMMRVQTEGPTLRLSWLARLARLAHSHLHIRVRITKEFCE